MKRPLANLVRKAARRAGYELRPLRSNPPDVSELESPADSIYAHRDTIFRVPVDHCYYPYVFSYGPEGWHPFVATLREALADPTLDYRNSTLCRFYRRYQPATLREALFEPGVNDDGSEALDAFSTADYLPLLPWDPALVPTRGEKGLDAGSHGHQGHGPVSDTKGALEFRRLVETMRSIEREGYRPAAHGDGEIRGYFLKTTTGYRFIIRSGLHRSAALSALGEQQLRVALYPHYPRAIHLCDSAAWPAVRGGYLQLEAAERYFLRFFEENGQEKAARLGLLAAGSP